MGLGEEIAQDAFVAALEQWPVDGVPPNPAGWLVTTARHKALDLVRRRGTYARKLAEVGRSIEQEEVQERGRALDDHIGDDLLRLVFTTCHPSLTTESRVALTLRLLGGLRTDEVARGLLISEATAAQRISRAKRTLAREGVAFDLPAADDMPDRLASVLEVVYLVFNEGYVATSGDAWARPELCHEAVRLARVLCALLPDEASVHALDALLELQSSRLTSRVSAAGEPVPLLDQDRRLWDRLLVRRGMAALERAHELGGARGAYALQAAIAVCHASAADGCGHRLAADRRPLRAAGGGLAVAGRVRQPGRRARDGRLTRGRSRPGRGDRRARRLSPAGGRARSAPRTARAGCRGARRLPGGRCPDPQRG